MNIITIAEKENIFDIGLNIDKDISIQGQFLWRNEGKIRNLFTIMSKNMAQQTIFVGRKPCWVSILQKPVVNKLKRRFVVN